MLVRAEDIEVAIHDTTPKTGMRHAGSYPKFIEVHHVPTGTRVTVGTEKSQIQNKNKALRGLEAILCD